MANKPQRKVNNRKTNKKGNPLTKRILSGIICLLSCLIILSLTVGYISIKDDLDNLKASGNIISWFKEGNSTTNNPVGIFGIVCGYIFIYLFGYWFSLIGFIIIAIVALHYFLTPESLKHRQKGYLLLIIMFFLQALIVSKQDIPGVVPLFVYRILAAVFSGIGAKIILIGAMILTAIMLIEYERLKSWILVARENLQRKKEQRTKTVQPTITANNLNPVPKAAEETIPVIQNHNQPNPPPEPFFEDIIKIPKEYKPKPVATEEDADREYQLPSIDDFLESPIKLSERERKEIENQIITTSQVLKSKLAEFGIEAEVKNVNIGPIITQYELEPAKGIKVSRFTSLADDLALAIKAKSIRVQAPIPGRGLIGIEIPNLARDMIYLKDLLLSEQMRQTTSKLAFGLGKDIAGKPIVADLAKMPHLLIAGATGSGKSVCINTIIMSLIMRTKPDELRLILIDPKRVELAGYNELPHLIGQVVTDADTALETFIWAVREMERRYEVLQEAKVRDIIGYNEKCREDEDLEPLPYIVIIVDEFADLIMTSGKDIEMPITRLAQMSRAVGMHLILATQRPSIKVITGIIKANFPARIAFQVSSRVDSRVILDMIGAERLLGNGDMLFLPPGKALPERIHGAFVSDAEIARVCNFLATQPKPKQDFSLVIEKNEGVGFFDYDDELFPEAAKVVVSTGTASVSMLQRHFKIGYARAGRLIDLLERARIIGPHLGSKSRDVLATREDLIRIGVIDEDR
ncbi:MAG TPA: DNA translocase FtsK [Candidatus Cloacimonas acidaminovorans]|nr:DNA translocase FtsK [Candidatus Cloacimonas acidaminovorans]HRS60065.1 DNA translocase FtsK [Candidatus Cloacimonas sp.]HOM78555.1 DNA translocase FtsK [Candidatus Cloacimonas acidaminovorans]HOS06670.1 DNA translocase FtsK [Candidatus Cloacimonas acidaminovorans]HOT38034.1 DNA translocase FtsK [Candidatus Cloacimonas acidaminovorans]